MKSTIKIFAVFAMVVGFAVGAKAQSAVPADITANANVQTQLTVVEQQSLEFGTVNNKSGETKTISVAGVASSSGGAVAQTGVRQGIGKITRSGDAQITYVLSSVPTVLKPSSGTSELPISNFTTAYSSTISGAQTAGNATVSLPTTVAGTGNDIFIHIGATVTPSSATTSTGIHTGEITLSAIYN